MNRLAKFEIDALIECLEILKNYQSTRIQHGLGASAPIELEMADITKAIRSSYE